VNDVTIGNYPRKIDEYLAMGKPTVATQTTAMEVFDDYCYLANSGEEYLKLIESALLTDNRTEQMRRRNFAMTHTWENNVQEIYKAIYQTIEKEEEVDY
jgi:glycosyltransferase involved in cell wall biosynthesis